MRSHVCPSNARGVAPLERVGHPQKAKTTININACGRPTHAGAPHAGRPQKIQGSVTGHGGNGARPEFSGRRPGGGREAAGNFRTVAGKVRKNPAKSGKVRKNPAKSGKVRKNPEGGRKNPEGNEKIVQKRKNHNFLTKSQKLEKFRKNPEKSGNHRAPFDCALCGHF